MKDYLHAPKDFIVPEARNATEWAKHQFWTWYLFWPRPSAKPYDGLDHHAFDGVGEQMVFRVRRIAICLALLGLANAQYRS